MASCDEVEEELVVYLVAVSYFEDAGLGDG